MMNFSHRSIGGFPAIRFMMILIVCAQVVSCGVGSRFNASISLQGKVIDERDEPLGGVRLDVRESRPSLGSKSFLSSDETVLELSDGRFQVACESCSGMNLHFAKDGYYSETVSFHVGKPEEWASRGAGLRS
ncbi:MAG: hypothetical protein HKN81_05760 [Gammaproteobacteria bacterium]|nr:hypothetical protein [Gammaproteobacteria bacterium]